MPEYMTNFRSEDMPGQISYATDSNEAESAAEKNEVSETPAETPAEAAPEAGETAGDAPSEVPEGTTAEILDWVGDDTDRAQAALDVEQASDKPRVGLTGELEKILSTEDGEAGSE